jgi:hypothetical protein
MIVLPSVPSWHVTGSTLLFYTCERKTAVGVWTYWRYTNVVDSPHLLHKQTLLTQTINSKRTNVTTHYHPYCREIRPTVHNILYSFKIISFQYFKRVKNSDHNVISFYLTLSILMSYIYAASSKARNLTYIYRRDILLGNVRTEPCVSLIYAWKTNKYTKYSNSLLIMYGRSYMFRHYIAIIRERSQCLLRNAQLRSSR